MNAKLLLSAIACLLLLTSPACQKPLDEENLIYLGDWSSRKHYIEIAANGYGFYQRRNRNGVDCRVKITDNRIIFNWDGGRKSFCIDTPPSVDLATGRVFMVLDGDEFLRH